MKNKILTTLTLGAMVFGLTACNTNASSVPATELPDTETAVSESADTESTETETSAIPDSETESESETAAASESSDSETPDTESTDNTSQETGEIPAIEDITVTSPEDAQLLLMARFGTEDAETGYSYSFGYIDTFTVDGAEYYGFVWSWLVDGDHLSRLTEVFVKTDGSAIYEGSYDGENCEFYTDNMM